jgi:hypothetical protein
MGESSGNLERQRRDRFSEWPECASRPATAVLGTDEVIVGDLMLCDFHPMARYLGLIELPVTS